MNEVEIFFNTDKSQSVSIICEVAHSIFEKMKGLMFREELAKNKGMLFTFLIPWHRFFWMKNVKIPLDIIFVNSKFKIIYIHNAPIEQGLLYKLYWSHGFCKYVVECNKGFCEKNDIKIGSEIKIIKKI